MANILIVDDVPVIRKNITRTLEKYQHSIMEASNGVKALKLLHEKKFDLIILDIMMPNKGGIETLLDIKNIQSLKKIIITGVIQTDSEAFHNLINQFGVKKILFKPFTKKQLVDAIDEVLKS